MKSFRFPEKFLIGSATAGAQIEGGDKNNSWYAWCVKGNIKDKSNIVRAGDHWNRYKEDIELLAGMNQKIYRMGLEWSRIEPEEGKFSQEAIDHYRSELSDLIGKGIRPLVTLHHFTNPLWLCEIGEFENPDVIKYYLRYVRFVVENLGDLISEYITINEPNVYALNGYVAGLWPPGKKSFVSALKVMKNMALCHIEAYKLIHALREEKHFKGKTRIGVAMNMRVFHSSRKYDPLDYLTTKLLSYLYQDGIIRLMSCGKAAFPANLFLPDGIKGFYCDFIGINYYSRSTIDLIRFRDKPKPGRPVNDLGWEIYPEGIAMLCKNLYKKYHVPIWITENGICVENDETRIKFIYDHLKSLAVIAKEGVPVERYYHWSFMDNFEWLDGESARFGLVHVNYETQKRTIKRSGKFFSEIAKNNGVTDEMVKKYKL